MNSFWNKVKFYLGLKCVVRYGDKGWVITKREFGIMRVCKSNSKEFWWCVEEFFEVYCLFDSKEAAITSMKTNRNLFLP